MKIKSLHQPAPGEELRMTMTVKGQQAAEVKALAELWQVAPVAVYRILAAEALNARRKGAA